MKTDHTKGLDKSSFRVTGRDFNPLPSVTGRMDGQKTQTYRRPTQYYQPL